MNIINKLNDRISSFYKTNKKPCNFYASETNAERAASKMAKFMGQHFETNEEAKYVVFYFEPARKWVAAFDINEIVRRPEAKGGYIGIATGFYTY